MVLEKILKKECKKIDEYARMEKGVAEYIFNFINLNYKEIKEVFTKDEELLYYDVKNLFSFLENEYVRPFGISTYSKQIPTPDIKLGLTRYEKMKNSSNFLKRLTEKGEKLIDEYRGLRRLPTVRETNEKMYSSFF